MKALVSTLIVVVGLLACGPAFASSQEGPPKVTLVLKEKMSCRQIKKLVKEHRLFVHCDPQQRTARAFTAAYLGGENMETVLRQVASLPKVELATPAVRYTVN